MASEYTPNQRYPLYTDQDKPNLRDQYNQAIREIDGDMKDALDDSSAVATALGAGFDGQHTVRMAVDSANTAIVDEATARQNADTALNTAISDEATARQNADTALNTAISDEATARSSADSNMQSAINSINADGWVTPRRIALSSVVPHLLVIGDSWSASSSGMVSKIAERMNIPQANVHNFAVGSTGFLMSGTPNFASQLNSAIADSTIPKNVPMYIAIIGGTNDLSNGFTIASQYATVINGMYDSIKQNFPMGKPIFFFMQAAKNRLYPYTLIRAVRASCKAQIVNMAWPIPLQFFADNMHPNSDGYTIAAEFIASNFGFGASINRAVSGEIHIKELLNSVLTSEAVAVANLRLAWTEHVLTAYMYMKNSSEIANGDFLDFINLDLNCPVRPDGTYIISHCVAMGIDSKFMFAVGNNRIAVRNHTELPVGEYISECSFVWA